MPSTDSKMDTKQIGVAFHFQFQDDDRNIRAMILHQILSESGWFTSRNYLAGFRRRSWSKVIKDSRFQDEMVDHRPSDSRSGLFNKPESSNHQSSADFFVGRSSHCYTRTFWPDGHQRWVYILSILREYLAAGFLPRLVTIEEKQLLGNVSVAIITGDQS